MILGLVLMVHAAVIGMSTAAPPLTAERIAGLPPEQRAVWAAYLKRSLGQLSFDQDELFIERSHLKGPVPADPPEKAGARSMPLDREAGFYGSAAARRIADTVVSFQLPNGGWSKNLDMSGPKKAPGQGYLANNLNRHPSAGDFDEPVNLHWNYAGTIDNDATNTEIGFLGRVIAATPGKDGEAYRAALVRAVWYLLDAQYPNGGWPQVWPLQGGYHDAITFNDDAVVETATTLERVADGEYGFVSAEVKARAGEAVARAVECMVKAQVVIGGRRTIWPQQVDMLTLEPVAARNFEPASLSPAESGAILVFLMGLPTPSAAVMGAVRDGVGWLEAHAMTGEAWEAMGGQRHLVAAAGARPLWPRYVSLETGRAIFGDRDKTIHDSVEELSAERRNGYAWYGTGAGRAVERFKEWPARR